MKARKLIEEKIQLKKLATEPDKPVKNPSQKIDELQLELLRAQLALLKEGKRCIVMMEGTDTAGKGGIIRRLTRHLDPRSAHVWPIGAPARWEQSRHYLFRFWQKLPEPGEITIFDRSWYGRVLVERVEGFATEAEWKRAFELFNAFDVDVGVRDIAATIDLIRKDPGCSGKVGAVGFCLGGLLAFQTATRTDIDASVAYYGVGIENRVEGVAKLTKPLMLHIAEEDQFVPETAQGVILAALKNHPLVTIHTYPGRDHAFARVGGQHYDEADARLANGRTLTFFQQHLD